MHERIAWPFTITVQAPHWPRPQPNFGSRSSRSSLSAYSRGVPESRSSVWVFPFTFRVIALISPPKQVGKSPRVEPHHLRRPALVSVPSLSLAIYLSDLQVIQTGDYFRMPRDA